MANKPHSGSPEGDSANKMWGGRFETKPAEIMEEINASLSFDRRFYAEDIRASQGHANMLCAVGILTDAEAEAIVSGLDAVRAEIAEGRFEFRREYEDIHMAVEARLKELIGPVAGKLHTARSRNDQVATDFRLYIRGVIDHLDSQIAGLQLALARKADRTRPRSCRASRICKRRSLSLSAIIASPMSKCWRATTAGLRMRESG